MRRVILKKRKHALNRCRFAEDAGKTAVMMWAIEKSFFESDNAKQQQLIDDQKLQIQQAVDYNEAQMEALNGLQSIVSHEKALKEAEE
jgi:hypothetical protein